MSKSQQNAKMLSRSILRDLALHSVDGSPGYITDVDYVALLDDLTAEFEVRKLALQSDSRSKAYISK